MNWRKHLLARRATFDSTVLAVSMYLAGLLSLATFIERDLYAFGATVALTFLSVRKGWRLWHALHRLARMP